MTRIPSVLRAEAQKTCDRRPVIRLWGFSCWRVLFFIVNAPCGGMRPHLTRYSGVRECVSRGQMKARNLAWNSKERKEIRCHKNLKNITRKPLTIMNTPRSIIAKRPSTMVLADTNWLLIMRMLRMGTSCMRCITRVKRLSATSNCTVTNRPKAQKNRLLRASRHSLAREASFKPKTEREQSFFRATYHARGDYSEALASLSSSRARKKVLERSGIGLARMHA
jgi:hypothetical protein